MLTSRLLKIFYAMGLLAAFGLASCTGYISGPPPGLHGSSKATPKRSAVPAPHEPQSPSDAGAQEPDRGAAAADEAGPPPCQPTTCAAKGAHCGHIADGCGEILHCGQCPPSESCGGGGRANVCGKKPCQPTTCQEQGADCGQLSDGCGGVLQCGSCMAPQICGGSGRAHVCGAKPCQPTTCQAKGANCGQIPDGCGKMLQCGSCTSPQSCGGGGKAHVCGEKPCQPTTCAAKGANCGQIPDGCGRTLSCGSCQPDQICGGGNQANVCGKKPCQPTTCAAEGADCGQLSDGCGGVLQCGSCTTPERCGGRGQPHVCAVPPCQPTTCAAQGANCGQIPDGCGKMLSCGSCTSPQSCGGGGRANVCGAKPCQPTTCQAKGANCGQIPDGCGKMLSCGSCTSPQSCGGGGKAHVCGTKPSGCASGCTSPHVCGGSGTPGTCGCKLSCPNGIKSWPISSPTSIITHTSGTVWLTKTVPTNKGWGLFWLQEPATQKVARLHYAHVDFSGKVSVAAQHLLDIQRISFRDRYYNAAWHTDRFIVLIAKGGSLYSHTLKLGDKKLSPGSVVGPRLLVSSRYDQECDSDMVSFPGGVFTVIEGGCPGAQEHSCAYAFFLDKQGKKPTTGPSSAVKNLVDFDYTHYFFPKAAYDGQLFTILMVKDIKISAGGPMTKTFTTQGRLSSPKKVLSQKQYMWDERTSLAHNGSHYGALWLENPTRSHSNPKWQVRFSSFKRTSSASTSLADQVVEVTTQRPGQRWTQQLHAVGCEWVAHYPRWRKNAEPMAVFQWLNDKGISQATLSPFPINANALGSSVHTAPSHRGHMGILRGYISQGKPQLTFHLLKPPICQ